MKIISKRQRIATMSYTRSFNRIPYDGGGFTFDCDEKGNVNEGALNPCALDSYHMCLRSPEKYEDMGAEHRTHTYNQPAVGECNRCKAQVVLHGFTNTCECGLDYNMSGQQLCERESWGEDTGESLSDILSIP